MRRMKYKGMSFVEMIMAIAIFAIGMEGFTLLFARSWQANSFIIEEGEASMIASRAVNEVIMDLRKVRQSDNGSYPVISGDDFDLKVYIDIDGDSVVEKVHYYLENEALKVGISNPSGVPAVYPSGDEEVKTLTTHVVNTSSQPIFYYYNSSYPGDPANNPLNTPINPEETRLIRVNVFLNPKPNKAPENLNVDSIVELRNINEYTQ